MKISELKAGISNVEIEAEVVEKDEPKEVITKYGKRVNVAHAVLKDDTGRISISLWGNDINSVDVGDKVRLSNCYVSEFRGTPQLSTGEFGKIEVKEKGKGSAKEEFSEADDDLASMDPEE